MVLEEDSLMCSLASTCIHARAHAHTRMCTCMHTLMHIHAHTCSHSHVCTLTNLITRGLKQDICFELRRFDTERPCRRKHRRSGEGYKSQVGSVRAGWS